jgi:conjugative transposon TraM protein
MEQTNEARAEDKPAYSMPRKEDEAARQQIQESKNEVKPPKEPDKPKKELTEEQRQKQKKLIVYPLMFIIFAVVMWLIFAPSDKEKEQEQSGFNTDVPAPADNALVSDKRDAYEQDLFNRKQDERREQMQDLASMFGSEEEQAEDMPTFDEPEVKPKSGYGGGSSRPTETIYASANAYRDMNRTLGNFYETPKDDPEKEEMRKELEELREMAYNRQTEKETADEQLALLEKSYQLAAKYMPQNQGQPFTGQPAVATAAESKPTEAYKNGKAQVNTVGQVHERVVSGLSQPMSDSAFVAEYSKERNIGFHTAVGTAVQTEKNTIRACIHDNQTVTDGQAVRLRLLEPMRAGETVIPQNALVTGMGKIQGERLGISITSLEYRGMIIPVELTVVDGDGQEGIFIPGSMEIDAIREIAANLGGNLGTTINLNQQSAGDQLLTDLGKGAIQGTSQYIAKKMRTIKVHLKAGYNLMLYQKKQ